MNKILFIGVVALAFTAFVSAQEYNSEASSKGSGSNSAFASESSDSSSSSSSSIPPFSGSSSSSSSHDDSSSSIPIVCKAGQYLDGRVCYNCSKALNCLTCTNGFTCASCDADHTLSENKVCVLGCTVKFGEGCEKCTERKCSVCNKQACCTKMKWYWNTTSSACVDPKYKFGEGCVETDGNVCTKCTAQTCCKEKEYYSFSTKKCETCASAFGASCLECVNGTCLNCGNDVMDGKGSCSTCNTLYGEGCDQCTSDNCTAVKNGYVLFGTNAMKCSALFGEQCSECQLDGCTKCSGDYKLFGGYCKTCQEVFGEQCASCDNVAGKCTGCTAESNTLLVNDVCVGCSNAFGNGCKACSSDGGCTGRDKGYFISEKYSYKCDIIDVESVRNDCESVPANMMIYGFTPRDGYKVTVTYDTWSKGFEGCDVFGDNCEDCSNAGCSKCNARYVLYGGECKSCSATFGNGCSACSISACTTCEGDYHLGADGKCVKCEGEKPLFDTNSKTCVSCDQLFSHCTTCDLEKCTACDDGYFADTDGKCKACSSVYGQGCSKCDKTKNECTECNSKNCMKCPEGKKVMVKDNQLQCLTCKEVFGEQCSECSETECTACADPRVLVDGECSNCGDLFESCKTCDADHCTACTKEGMELTDNGCYEVKVISSQSSSHTSPVPQPSQSSVPVKKSSGKIVSGGGLGAGAIAGIVIGCVFVLFVVFIFVYCVATNGKKRGKIDPVIYEEDPEFISMSVL